MSEFATRPAMMKLVKLVKSGKGNEIGEMSKYKSTEWQAHSKDLGLLVGVSLPKEAHELDREPPEPAQPLTCILH